MKQPTEREIIRALKEAERLIREQMHRAKHREVEVIPHGAPAELALRNLMNCIECVRDPYELLRLRDFVNAQVERVVPRVQQEAHAASSNGHVFGQRR